MKRKFWKRFVRNALYVSALLIGFLWIVSCEDPYPLDNEEPTWLGASIYDYLKTEGNYTYYIRLIEDLNYTDVLSKTGSKTVFVANDSAFNKFFQNNDWGISSYEQLSLAQKKILFKFSIINNAYLIETLSNYNWGAGLVEGGAMRRETSLSIFDTIPFLKGDALPNGSLKRNYWARHKEKGLHLLKDDTSWPLVYFLPKQMEYANITNDDFKVITGITRSQNDAYIFKNKIIKRDITCKNGYINVLDNVLIPAMNMADFLRTSPKTTIFSALLHRFCAPYFSEDATTEYRQNHPDFTDSIFVFRFFNNPGGFTDVTFNPKRTYPYYITYYPDNRLIDPNVLLNFNPEYNSYLFVSTNDAKPLQADFAAIFAPTDEAMNNYFNNGPGKLLKDTYGSWDNVPDDNIATLVNLHIRTSFLNTLPSQFETLVNDKGDPVPARKSEIDSVYLGMNGVVYLYNNVFSPLDFEVVAAPVLLGSRTSIFKWAITVKQADDDVGSSVKTPKSKFVDFLKSTGENIVFSYFVPTDQFFSEYVDPVTLAKEVPGALKFWYNKNSSTVNATVYKYNVATNTLGDSVGVINNSTFVKNRLIDILKTHIILDNVGSGKKYYLSYNGNAIKINGTSLNSTVEGGGDIQTGKSSKIIDIYNERNGKTYFIDKPILAPTKSIYNVLSNTPQFSEFFDLMLGFEQSDNLTDTAYNKMFVSKKLNFGIDYNIRFLNTFNYTLYVPTNNAIKQAYIDGIIAPWESKDGIIGINQMDPVKKQAALLKLEKFIRYHFQDNSVFFDNGTINGEKFPTATLKIDDSPSAFNTYRNKFYKLKVTASGTNFTINTETYGSANIVTDEGLYNILTRDYKFNSLPGDAKEIDGSGSGKNNYTDLKIETSYTTVIHQIDKVLLFQ